MSTPVTDTAARESFERLLPELRPRLHRYCARMTGSVIDGEDVLQEALVKAIESLPRLESITQMQGWLFRIAHNAALDFLRRRARLEATRFDQEPDVIADPVSATERRVIADAGLRTFMRLPVAQRSSVILMDVLGHSLEEISDVLDSSVPAVKAALHRGRARLLELAREPDDFPPPILSEPERSLLAAYVDRFNARDFDAVRDMLADEVRLELVNKTRLNGRQEVGRYFHNYSLVRDWRFVPGFVDRRPAILVCHPDDPSARPAYFVLLQWAEDRLAGIRDFRYAPYAIDGAELLTKVAGLPKTL